MLWGKKDLAVEIGLATDGIADYSSVAEPVRGHGEGDALDAAGSVGDSGVREVLLWAVSGEHGKLEEVLGDMGGVKVVTE